MDEGIIATMDSKARREPLANALVIEASPGGGTDSDEVTGQG